MTGGSGRRSERGAATLETTGVAIIASLIVVALLTVVTPQARIMGETVSYAICQVVTFGQGGCTPPSSPPDAHVPTEPCVTNQNAVDRNQKLSVIIVTLEDGRRIEMAQLSNGEYRVTVTDSEGAGVETGVGGGLSVTINDRTGGLSASASAGASINLKSGEVYYADEDGIGDLMSALTQDQIMDTVVGEGGPLRWVVDKGGELIGVGHNMPDPDETYSEGGFSLNASAQATGLLDSGQAGISGAAMLGSSQNRDGSTTVYLKSSVSGEVGLQTLGYDTEGDPQFQGLDMSGSIDVVNAVTFDSSGNMVSVRASVAMAGSSSGLATALFNGSGDVDLDNSQSGATLLEANLPLKTQADQDVANNYLLSLGVGSLGAWTNPALVFNGQMNFYEAVGSRGQMTQVRYDTDSSTPFAIDAAGKYVVELGISGSVTTESMTVTDAQYWDGAAWVDWEDCSA